MIESSLPVASTLPRTPVSDNEMASNLRVEVGQESDFLELVSIIVPAFSGMAVEAINNGIPTPENLKRAADNHLRAWREHARDFLVPSAIKCVYSEPESGIKKIVGAAEWFIYTHERTEEEYKTPNHLFTASWVEDEADRKNVLDFLEPMIQGRIKWMGSRPYGLLIYMAVLPEWRRKGVSTQCVQWGLDKCQELGIPAYLEASKEGALVYEKLGFEYMDEMPSRWAGKESTFPVMIKWPAGTREEDKRPALPDTVI